MNQTVDEAQLRHDRRRQNEGIEVRLAHAVVEAVDGIGERQPRLEQRVEVAMTVGIELDLHREAGARPALGAMRRPKAAAVSSVSTMCR